MDYFISIGLTVAVGENQRLSWERFEDSPECCGYSESIFQTRSRIYVYCDNNLIPHKVIIFRRILKSPLSIFSYSAKEHNRDAEKRYRIFSDLNKTELRKIKKAYL